MQQTISFGTVADIYDDYVRVDFDIPFFLLETAAADGKALELTSGTGRVSLPLLKAGIDLTCVDYSEEMLAVLKKKMVAENLSCPVICADMTQLSLQERYDLIFIPFNSFSEVVDRDAHAKTLRGIAAHLSERGEFICTLHNPPMRITSLDGTRRAIGTFPRVSGGSLTLYASVRYDPETHIAAGIQEYEIFDANRALCERRLLPVRFYLFSKMEFEQLALEAGFKTVALYGNYDRTPFNEATSPFLIWKLRRI